MKVALIDVDGKITNLALQKLSTWHKAQGDQVVLNPLTPDGIDKTYVSLIFSASRPKAVSQYQGWPEVEFGGTGFDLTTTLDDDVEKMIPDFQLYTAQHVYERIKTRPGSRESAQKKAQEIVDAGIGFLSRGCVNSSKTCPWCVVPAKEGFLNKTGSLNDLINPRSSKIKLLDNSFGLHPDILDILAEVEKRKLSLDITQGIDIRRLDSKVSHALSKIRHWGDIKYSWDHPQAEKSVLSGIRSLSRYVKPSKQKCYFLIGHGSSFEEDMLRVQKLKELGVTPFAMLFRDPNTPARNEEGYAEIRRKIFVQWVNLPKALYKSVAFTDFDRWIRAQARMAGSTGAQQLSLAL